LVKRSVGTRGRLGFFGREADQQFWGKHWNSIDIGEWVYQARRDTLLLPTIQHYLPSIGKILDAGCGIGQYLAVLRERGYDIEGIDFSEEVVNHIKKFDPDLPVRVGNVLNLPYPNNHFKAILSIGVVEHFEEGPEIAIIEAHRVLKERGILLIAVPYFNMLRRLKDRLGFYRGTNSSKFYQYAFTKQEFNSILNKLGFIPIDAIPYNARKGLRDEVSLFRLLSRFLPKTTTTNNQKASDRKDKSHPRLSTQINHTIKVVAESFVVRSLTGHMILFATKKE